uniref:Uncharacterized protein n=1 Tax=Anopheles minimus TaxID=112268 RepID=A0A182WP96_9DIPT
MFTHKADLRVIHVQQHFRCRMDYGVQMIIQEICLLYAALFKLLSNGPCAIVGLERENELMNN